MNLLAAQNRKPILDLTLALSATIVIVFLVINDGLIPSVFTTAFFAPITGLYWMNVPLWAGEDGRGVGGSRRH